ncbi:protein of unknown function [Paraburkholderia kururiensis]|jgi:hypothetical protein
MSALFWALRRAFCGSGVACGHAARRANRSRHGESNERREADLIRLVSLLRVHPVVSVCIT